MPGVLDIRAGEVTAIVDHERSRAEEISRTFALLWPIVVAVVGLGLVVAFAAIPSLRDPALIAALSGLFTVAGTVGLARKESK